MRNMMLFVAVAFVVGIAGGVWATEEPRVEAETVSVEPQSEAMTADAWLEAQATVLPEAIFAGQQCGGAICGKFEYCCNPTCSMCVLFGMSCTQEAC